MIFNCISNNLEKLKTLSTKSYKNAILLLDFELYK